MLIEHDALLIDVLKHEKWNIVCTPVTFYSRRFDTQGSYSSKWLTLTQGPGVWDHITLQQGQRALVFVFEHGNGKLRQHSIHRHFFVIEEFNGVMHAVANWDLLGDSAYREVTYVAEAAHYPESRNRERVAVPLSLVERYIDETFNDLIFRIRISRGPNIGVQAATVNTVEEAAGKFDLFAKPGIYEEISLAEAAEHLASVLHRDMAYDHEIMPATQAKTLAHEFVNQFSGECARFFTNGSYGNSRDGMKSLAYWTPATESTFDTGILVVTPTRIGCAWFMDED